MEEVRQALAGGSRNHLAALVASSGKVHLGEGAPVRTSPAEERQRGLRAVESARVTVPGRTVIPDRATRSSATAELFGHARRVLVATGR